MKNIIAISVLAAVMTSSSMAGMNYNSFESIVSNYHKEMSNKANVDHVLLAGGCSGHRVKGSGE